MRALDTNVLVRLVTGDERRQTRIAEEFVANGAWVSTLVLTETIWVLADSYRRTRAELQEIIERLTEQESIILEDPTLVVAALERFRSHSSVGFSDCLILELARKAGHLPLGTFDRALAKLDGAQRL